LEILTWDDIAILIDNMIPQSDMEFEGMMINTCSGINLGGLLTPALKLEKNHFKVACRK